MGRTEHGGDPIVKDTVGDFCYSILLRGGPGGVLTSNTMFLHEFLPLLGHVLSTLVISKGLDGPASLVLSKGLELFECCERLILSLQ